MSPVRVWHQPLHSPLSWVQTESQAIRTGKSLSWTISNPAFPRFWCEQQAPPGICKERARQPLCRDYRKDKVGKSSLGQGHPSFPILKNNPYTDSLTWSWMWILQITYSGGFKSRPNNCGVCGSFNTVSTGIIYHLCIERQKYFSLQCQYSWKEPQESIWRFSLPLNQVSYSFLRGVCLMSN